MIDKMKKMKFNEKIAKEIFNQKYHKLYCFDKIEGSDEKYKYILYEGIERLNTYIQRAEKIVLFIDENNFDVNRWEKLFRYRLTYLEKGDVKNLFNKKFFDQNNIFLKMELSWDRNVITMMNLTQMVKSLFWMIMKPS